MNKVQFYFGLALAIIAAIIIVVGDSDTTTGISIVIGILAIGLIATARRKGL